MTKEIITFGGNETKRALYGFNSRDVYKCANSSLTRGLTYEPITLKDCFDRFPSVRKIAQYMGFITGICGFTGSTSQSGSCGPSGGYTYQYDLWTGSTSLKSATLLAENLQPIHIYLNQPSKECDFIIQELGEDWLGCLWGTPAIPFSCTCPNIGSNFYAFLKLRLNVATFWNTPKDAPVKRAEFLDGFNYGRKINVTIAGDFKIKIGQVVEVITNAASGYPYADGQSVTNGFYYIIGIKHVVTNSGGHEMILALSQIAKPTATGTGSAIIFSNNYP